MDNNKSTSNKSILDNIFSKFDISLLKPTVTPDENYVAM